MGRHERIDVQFDDVFHVTDELRYGLYRANHGVDVDRGHITVPAQQVRDARARHEFSREQGIQRRQGHSAVPNALHGCTAVAKEHHRTEHRIVGGAEDEFERRPARHHALDREPLDPGERCALPHRLHHRECDRQNLFIRTQVERHAARIGLV
ncbi:hypothetical protein D3C81_1358840 [compost metagenome]